MWRTRHPNLALETMSAHRITWSPPRSTSGTSSGQHRSLEERLSESAHDRAAGAVDTALEAAGALREWVSERPREWEFEQAGRELEEGWREWIRHQGWRGSCAILVDALRRAFQHAVMRAHQGGPRALLLEELAAWLSPDRGGTERWNGAPLAPGPRFSPKEDVAPQALETLSRGEWILVHGHSPTVLAALVQARQNGLFPRVLLGEGGPDQGGKRMARELAKHGIGVRLTWDAAVLSAVDEADRVWVGTEAIGAGCFLGLAGTGLLLEEAARLEVPAAVLCTGDDLVPGGEARLPAWGDDETWNLWTRVPDGVELASQPYETVNADLVDTWLTDAGRERLGELCLRAMRPVAAPPCTGEG